MKTPFELPDKDCERLNRTEMAAVRMMMILCSMIGYAKDDLKDRLRSVPGGNQRMSMLVGSASSLFVDIIGTVTDKQRRQLRNTAKDYNLRLVPKASPEHSVLAVEEKDLRTLVNCAKTKCQFCSMDGNECRQCEMYKFLEVYIPLEDYGPGLMCPYWNVDWED